MTEAIHKGQVNQSAADIYEEFFVPALFLPWAGIVAEAANIKPGDAVLDVACGTGVLSREAAKRTGQAGSVTGVDINEGMLDTAARTSSDINWVPGKAEDLPFETRSFDAVTSQFGLMFFEDKTAALEEMWRVLKPGGRLVVAVWGELEQTPGYAAMARLLERLFGDGIADAIRAPYRLGNRDTLCELFLKAGVTGAETETLERRATFSSIDAWVHTDIKGWTLADLIDDDQYQLLIRAAKRELANFQLEDGRCEFAAPAHITVATKP